MDCFNFVYFILAWRKEENWYENLYHAWAIDRFELYSTRLNSFFFFYFKLISSLKILFYGFESNISQHSHCCGTPSVLKRQILDTVKSLFRSFKTQTKEWTKRIGVVHFYTDETEYVSLRIVRTDAEQVVRFSYLSFLSYNFLWVYPIKKEVQAYIAPPV